MVECLICLFVFTFGWELFVVVYVGLLYWWLIYLIAVITDCLICFD